MKSYHIGRHPCFLAATLGPDLEGPAGAISMILVRKDGSVQACNGRPMSIKACLDRYDADTPETIDARFFVIDALPEMSATHNDTQRFDGHLILRLACRHALLTAENTKVLCFRV